MKLTRIGVGATLTAGVLLFAAAAPAYAADEAGESETFASSVAEADGAESTAAASTTTETDAIPDAPVFIDPTPTATDEAAGNSSASDDASAGEEPSTAEQETPAATDDESERPAQPAPIVSTTDWRDVAPNCESGVYTQIRDYTETPYVWDDVNGVWAVGSASETTTQTGTRPMTEAELQSCPGNVPDPAPSEEPAPTEEPTGPDAQPAPPANDSDLPNPAPSSPVDEDVTLPTIGNSAPAPVDDDATHDNLSATGANASSAGLLGVLLAAGGAGLLAVRRSLSVNVA